jgi:hypothetical protein
VTRVRIAAVLAASAALAVGVAVASGGTNDISTAAGTGTAGFSGDDGPATAAQIGTPTAVAATADGGYLIADQGNSRVRRVSPAGVITTVAGNGTPGFGGDDGLATSAQLNAPNGLAETADGGFLIADSNNNRVRKVSPAGIITTVAGGGTGGDGGPATNAALAFPVGVAARADGSFLIGDNDSHSVRQVDAGGTITTVAGTGSAGFGGDDGPATSAQLFSPAGVALMPDGGFLIADADNARVRRVSPGGTITTLAGTGSPGFAGDGGAATLAQLNNPLAAVPVAGGGVAIADTNNHRVRQVLADGTITTVAGTGTPGFAGDGGPAVAGQLNGPFWVALTTAGHLVIADTFNHRVRLIEGPPPPPPPPLPPAPPQPPVTLEDLPTPRIGREVNVGPVGDGPVLIAVPGESASARAGASQKGLTFVPLTEARQIPVGSFLDTKRGTVELVSATGRDSRTQSGRFREGLFQVLQSRARRAKGLTELRLKGSSFKSCRTSRRGASAGAAQLSRRTIRRLRSNATGRFRTRGRHASATVRGTIWITADRCDGTLTKVRRGRVAVRDFRRKRTILVRTGKSYLARAPR